MGLNRGQVAQGWLLLHGLVCLNGIWGVLGLLIPGLIILIGSIPLLFQLTVNVSYLLSQPELILALFFNQLNLLLRFRSLSTRFPFISSDRRLLLLFHHCDQLFCICLFGLAWQLRWGHIYLWRCLLMSPRHIFFFFNDMGWRLIASDLSQHWVMMVLSEVERWIASVRVISWRKLVVINLLLFLMGIMGALINWIV